MCDRPTQEGPWWALFLVLFENILGNQCAGHGHWPAAIEGKMGDQFADLFWCNAVVERALEMAL